MQILRKTKGSSLIVSLGLMSLLLILGGSVISIIFRSAHLTNNIANANKAYFAAEAGLEEGLYELTNHLSGFEAEDSLSFANNSKYDYEIEYLGNSGESIPATGEGTSPSNADWNRINYKETFNLNLFYDESEIDTKADIDCSDSCDLKNANLGTLNVYIRTPDDNPLKNDGDVYISWMLTGIDANDSDKKYTLLPITDKTNPNYSEIVDTDISGIGGIVLNLYTWGTDLDGTESQIFNFLNTANLVMPRLRISVVNELKDNVGNPLPYLEFKIEQDDLIPDSYATITSEGYAGITKQSIRTKIKQEGALSLFDYAIFQ